MLKTIKKTWLASTVFMLVLSLSVTYLFLPGLSSARAGGAGGIALMILAVAICYIAASVFLGAAPCAVFLTAQKKTLKESLLSLSKLAAALAVFTIAFAVISGLAAALVFYVLATGLPEESRRAPLTACIYIILLLSLPFFARVFSGFAAGDTGFASLIKASARMGALLYAKLLIPCAAAYALALLIRWLLAGAGLPGNIFALALTAIAFGFAIPVSWHIYSAGLARQRVSARRAGPKVSARGKEAQNA